eukprot:SAG31_NODE_3663_length_4010_cov_4.327330_7_plen_167_part_00
MGLIGIDWDYQLGLIGIERVVSIDVQRGRTKPPRRLVRTAQFCARKLSPARKIPGTRFETAHILADNQQALRRTVRICSATMKLMNDLCDATKVAASSWSAHGVRYTWMGCAGNWIRAGVAGTLTAAWSRCVHAARCTPFAARAPPQPPRAPFLTIHVPCARRTAR